MNGYCECSHTIEAHVAGHSMEQAGWKCMYCSKCKGFKERPRFSVITPTIQRESLRKTCEVLDQQYFRDFEHVIQIDRLDLNAELIFDLAQPNRWFFQCDKEHRNGGNTCRNIALEKSVGEYIIYNDDDNFLADCAVLADISFALDATQNPPFALFPIHRLGSRFYTDPPRSCHVDTLNVVLRRDYAQWPDTDAYGTDGILVDGLMERKVPYAAFPDFRPIAVLPSIGYCK